MCRAPPATRRSWFSPSTVHRERSSATPSKPSDLPVRQVVPGLSTVMRTCSVREAPLASVTVTDAS